MRWTKLISNVCMIIGLLGSYFVHTSDAKASDWRAINGAMTYKNETLFAIKGVNWFGFETCDYVVHGLWVHPLTWYLDFIQANDFNVIRLPFSQQWVLHSWETQKPNPQSISADSSLQGKTSLEIMDIFFEECRKRGIFILLDMHRLKCEAQSHELWYSIDGAGYTNETFFQSWQKMIDRYANYPNFHGVDLLNEPRSLANWGNDPSTSWNLCVEAAYKTLRYDGTYYAEGIDWGRSFEGMKDHPIRIDDQTRIIYSSHVYGPSVVGNMNLDPIVLHSNWHKIFGYLVLEHKTVVIGEWGGRFENADRVWQNLFVDYLLSVRVPGIYWSLNPNSGDTGGLLQDDWTNPRTDKLELLQRLQPYPTKIENISDSPVVRRMLRTPSH